MLFLLDTAASGSAQGTPAAGGEWMTWIILIAFVAIFYFLMIRPQRKKDKEDAAMRDALEVGDEITTIGGVIGEVVSIKEDTVTIETSKYGTKIRFLKNAIRSVDVRAADKRAPQPEEDKK